MERDMFKSILSISLCLLNYTAILNSVTYNVTKKKDYIKLGRNQTIREHQNWNPSGTGQCTKDVLVWKILPSKFIRNWRSLMEYRWTNG